MSRVRALPAWSLKFLENAAGLDAVRRFVRPSDDFARVLDRRKADRAALAIDAFEARAGSAETRRNSGTYFTPPAVVDALLERLFPTAPGPDDVLLDPAVGAGAFVLALVRRFGAGVLDRLFINDVDPDALEATTLVLEAALGPDTDLATWRRTHAFRTDFLREEWPGPKPTHVLGNPPYGLSGATDLRARFDRFDGNRELAACFIERAAELLEPNGRLALLVPDAWLTNRGAVRFREHLARPGGLSRLVDFGKPFRTARDVRVHGLFLGGADSEADVRVEGVRGERLVTLAPMSRAALRDQAGKGWTPYRTVDEVRACEAIEAASVPLGTVFDVVYGLRTGDNTRYVARTPGKVPLVGGEDVGAYDRRWKPKSLTEPEAFPVLLPKQLGRWKIGLQRIRSNSTRPWRRWLEGALLTPDEVGLDSLSLVAEKSAGSRAAPSEALLALLGLLGSAPLDRWYKLHFTDVNVKPHYLGDLPVPRTLVDGRLADLAALVRRRLDRPGDVVLERAIDRLAYDAWQLAPDHVATLEASTFDGHPDPPPLLAHA